MVKITIASLDKAVIACSCTSPLRRGWFAIPSPAERGIVWSGVSAVPRNFLQKGSCLLRDTRPYKGQQRGDTTMCRCPGFERTPLEGSRRNLGGEEDHYGATGSDSSSGSPARPSYGWRRMRGWTRSPSRTCLAAPTKHNRRDTTCTAKNSSIAVGRSKS